MPDIRYVCLSDLHLGEEDSLLTHLNPTTAEPDPLHASPALDHLVTCLRQLIGKNEHGPKPTLILNGDILELALTTDEQAAMGFQRFIERVMGRHDALFDRIIYIPGNHDHHLWESARETQYVNFLTRATTPKAPLPPPWHTTKLFVEDDPHPVPSYFLTRLVQQFAHLSQLSIPTVYPNFGLLREDGQKCVIFHHGHYIEPLYQLISTVKTYLFPQRHMPSTVWTIEAENFAWIDFFWSTMGRSGEAGQDIETLYERMHDPTQCRQLLATLATSLAQRYGLPQWCDAMEAGLFRGVFEIVAGTLARRERRHSLDVLSAEAEQGLKAYVNGPLYQQMFNELKDRMPAEVTLVFGHTHKPFQEGKRFEKFPHWVHVYNTGGWVVETVHPASLRGAAVVLIDEQLDAVSLRIYQESQEVAGSPVRIAQAMHPGELHHPFYNRLIDLVNPAQEPWRQLSATLAYEGMVRAQRLGGRISGRAGDPVKGTSLSG